MPEAVIGVLSAVIGFLGKSAWDLFWKQRQDRLALAHKKRIDFLENQLSRFYWPVYIRLQKDNVVWERLLDRAKDGDDLRAKVGHAIEAKFLLPNHEEAIRIIQENIHLARAGRDLEEQLLRYVRHVAVYKAIRDSGTGMDPIALGEPWPDKLFPLIAEQTRALQAEYDRLIGWVV